ncbi:metal-dependent hydrolase [Candidatus Micrarchaeota archaeon]|nr:metal-dependent hydrolase [Candidatus Micrarchaeota archaeon]
MTSFLAHAVIGIALGLVILSALNISPANPVVYSITILLLVIGALIPDIDHEQSFATRVALLLATVLVMYVLSKQLEELSKLLFDNIIMQTIGVILAFIILNHVVNKFYRAVKPVHRGFIHSYSAAVIFTIAVYTLTANAYATLLLVLGYISHLWADGLFFKVT